MAATSKASECDQ